MYKLEGLQRWEVRREVNGKWVPARPEDGPWLWRVRDAWEVFRGRADAFTWPDQGNK